MRALPPADYDVAAADKRRFADVAAETDNPEVLESLAATATRVTLGAGQRISLTLRVGQVGHVWRVAIPGVRPA